MEVLDPDGRGRHRVGRNLMEQMERAMTDVNDITLQFEAVKLKISQDKSGYILHLSVHPSDVPVDLFTSWVGTRYQVVMVELLDDGSPKTVNAARASEKAIQQAGIMCREPDFQAFLGNLIGTLITTNEECSEALRQRLGIESRKDFKTNHEARIAFLTLRDKYLGRDQSGQPD